MSQSLQDIHRRPIQEWETVVLEYWNAYYLRLSRKVKPVSYRADALRRHNECQAELLARKLASS